MQRFLAFMVLLNYLAVLLAAQPLPHKPLHSAGNPYVHTKTCQQEHYLMLDCFDTCQGDLSLKQAVKKLPSEKAVLLLAGLDAHLAAAVSSEEMDIFGLDPASAYAGFSAAHFCKFYPSIFPPPKLS